MVQNFVIFVPLAMWTQKLGHDWKWQNGCKEEKNSLWSKMTIKGNQWEIWKYREFSRYNLQIGHNAGKKMDSNELMSKQLWVILTTCTYYRVRFKVACNWPFAGAWLTGDLTNHNEESAILSDKQFWQERNVRLTSVDLNLKNGVYWRLSAVEIKYLLMFIHFYFVL